VLHPDGLPLPSAEQDPATQVSTSLGKEKSRNIKEVRAWGQTGKKWL